MKYDFDIVVIGAGSAGLFAASMANTLGAKTCLIEKSRLGGDCTWYGCVPSKALIKSAQTAHAAARLGEFGLGLPASCSINADGVLEHVRRVRAGIARSEAPQAFTERGIDVIIGAARFISPSACEAGGKTITAKKYIVCTGSHPFIPSIEGLSNIDFLTNESIFESKRLPESLLVLGAGPIGLEISQSFNRLGIKVSVVEIAQRILIHDEPELADIVKERLIREGIALHMGRKAVSFSRNNGLIDVTVQTKQNQTETLSAEKLLVAVGRAPNLEGLALENAGVIYTKKGIKVNSYLQTSNKNIFAAGDVVGPYLFTHVAAYHASVAVRNAFFRRAVWQKVSYANIAWTTFTDPELAHVGMTENEARGTSSKIKVYTNEYKNCDRARTDLETQGLIKVITDKKGCIMGAHIAGAKAGELIQGFLLAKSLKIPLKKLSTPLFVYPTLSELTKKTAAGALLASLKNPLVKFIVALMKKA